MLQDGPLPEISDSFSEDATDSAAPGKAQALAMPGRGTHDQEDSEYFYCQACELRLETEGDVQRHEQEASHKKKQEEYFQFLKESADGPRRRKSKPRHRDQHAANPNARRTTHGRASAPQRPSFKDQRPHSARATSRHPGAVKPSKAGRPQAPKKDSCEQRAKRRSK